MYDVTTIMGYGRGLQGNEECKLDGERKVGSSASL